MLNRTALIVRPAQPYLDWAKSLDDSEVAPDPKGEQTVYLIPPYESLEEGQARLPELFEHVFELELQDWHLVEEDWPKDRSVTQFNRWFDAEVHTIVEDLCADPIEDDGPDSGGV